MYNSQLSVLCAWCSLALWMSVLDNVLRPLMNHSVNRDDTLQPFNDLDRLREEILANIDNTIQGTMTANLSEEVSRYITDGIVLYYYNRSYVAVGVGFTISDDDRACAIKAINDTLFPQVEQDEIASLGNGLQQIAVAYEVTRAVSA